MSTAPADHRDEQGRRASSTGIRDMALSLAVIMVPVALIYAFFSHTPEPSVTAVDWAAPYARARAEAGYKVLAPRNLPATWVPTVARFSRQGEALATGDPAVGNTWQLGFLTPETMYVGLTQRDTDGAGLVRQLSRGGVNDGTSTVAGRTWRRLVSEDGRTRTLTITADGATTVLVGDVTYVRLEAFAGTLASG